MTPSIPYCRFHEKSELKRFRLFNLIELLLVLSVLALLVSFVSPSLKNALGKAKTLLCQQNFSRIGSVLYIYSEDYLTARPIHDVAVADLRPYYWQSSVDSELCERTITVHNYKRVYSSQFDCPANAFVTSEGQAYDTEYSMDRQFVDFPETRVDKIESPDTHIYLMELKSFRTWINLHYHNPALSGFYGHDLGTNILYVDLHVSRESLDYMTKLAGW